MYEAVVDDLLPGCYTFDITVIHTPYLEEETRKNPEEWPFLYTRNLLVADQLVGSKIPNKNKSLHVCVNSLDKRFTFSELGLGCRELLSPKSQILDNRHFYDWTVISCLEIVISSPGRLLMFQDSQKIIGGFK